MSNFLNLIITFAPLLVILWVANLAERRREQDEPHQALALLAYLAMASMLGLATLAGISLQIIAPLVTGTEELNSMLGAAGLDPENLAPILSNPTLGISIWLPALLGLALLTPPVRRLCARVIPIDAESPVHAISLSFSMLIVINTLVTVSVGLDQVSEILAQQQTTGEGSSIPMTLLWGQQLLMLLMALVGVGWLSRRSFGQVMRRLDLVRPSGQDVLIGVGVALLMVPVSALIQGIATLIGIGVDPAIEDLTNQLIGDLFTTPWGILTLGLAAAIGEEPLFRGALQPRFGLVLTALIFAVVHSNYGLSASTVLVFVLGLVLGVLRIRRNTTTSVIAHATYNGIIGLMAYLAFQFMDF